MLAANNETIIMHGNSFIIMFIWPCIISKQGGKYDFSVKTLKLNLDIHIWLT